MIYYPTKLLTQNINNGITIEISGKTVQDGTPSPDNPIEINCVKQGTYIHLCDDNYNSIRQLTVPCDLYEGDIWNPITGKVQRNNKVTTINDVGTWTAYPTVSSICRFQRYVSNKRIPTSNVSDIWCTTLCKVNATATEQSITELANQTAIRILTDKGTTDTVAEMLEMHGDSQLVYKLNATVTEQYSIQLKYVPSKVTQVIQVPEDGGLEATVTITVP